MATMSNPGMGPDSAANRTSRFRPQTSMAEELARAQTFTGATGAALATLEGDALVWLGAVGENPPKAGDRWSLAGSFVKLCLGRKTRPQRCDNVEGDGRVDAAFRGLHAKSLAIAPVHDEGKVTGILAVFSNNHSAFNGMHTAVLQTEADHLAELVQQARSAVGIQGEKKAETPAENPQPVAGVTAPAAATTTAPASAPPQRTAQQESEALEAAFVVIPPPVVAPSSTPRAEVVPPVPPATSAAAAPGAASTEAPALPKLMVVPTPPPSPAPTSAPERPTLPGFMPLSATAAALAKAKPVPPTPPEMVVERKTPKPSVASPQSATEAKKPVTQPAPATPTSVPTPPPMRATAVPRTSAATPVPTPPPAPVAAAAWPPVVAPKPAEPSAVKFVPLAKPEFKTPPPGSVKPVTKETKETADEFLPAAADPFAEAAPVHLRSQARTTSAAIPTRAILAGLEGAESKPAASTWKLPLAVALVSALALGGLWWKTRHPAPAAAKAVPAVTQPAPAPAPAATTEIPATTTVTGSPAAAAPAPSATNITAETVPPSKPSVTTDKPAPEKAAPQIKTQPAAATAATSKPPAAAPSVTAPANTEVKTSVPVNVPAVARQQEPPPKTMLSVPAAAATRMPDLPKPEAPAAGVLRQASTPVAAQLLESVQPVYPLAAKAMHLQGTVRVSAKLSPQGRVTEVTWISGNSFFRDNVISAVKQWRYKPASVDGQPIESTVEIVLKFMPQ